MSAHAFEQIVSILARPLCPGAVEGKYVHYLRFDGREWSKPMRLDMSENKSSGVTRPDRDIAKGRPPLARIAANRRSAYKAGINADWPTFLVLE